MYISIVQIIFQVKDVPFISLTNAVFVNELGWQWTRLDPSEGNMSDKHTGSTAIPEHASDCSSQCLGGSNLFPMLSRLEQNSKGQALIIPHLIFCLWQQLCCCSFLHCLFSNLLTILNVLPIFFPSRKTPYTLPSPPSPTQLKFSYPPPRLSLRQKLLS